MVSDFLTLDAKFVRLAGLVAAGTTAQGTTFSRAGFDNVMIVVMTGIVVDAAVMTLAISTGDQSNGSDKVAVSGATSGAITASTSSNIDLCVDVKLNDDDYVTWDFTRTTQNVTIQAVWALLYNGRTAPVVTTNFTNYARAVAL